MFVADIEKFVPDQGIPLINSDKGQRKEDVAPQFRADFTKPEGCPSPRVYCPILSGCSRRIPRVLKRRKARETCREGSNFGLPQRHQTLIRAKRDRFCINGKTSSGSLLPIVSMMQTADARE